VGWPKEKKMSTIKTVLAGYLDFPVRQKTLPVLSVVEGLLGVASEYQGCSDPGQLPSVEVTDGRCDGLMVLMSGTNLVGKAASWMTEFCEDKTTQDEEVVGDSAVLESDKARLLRIRALVDQMITSGC
jgi:hypothetical protein